MSDQGFTEIQLSGKQLVFLFMSLLVMAVVVFLLGVSVGRGVRGAALAGAPAATSASPSTDTVVSTGTPPPTQTSPNELDYHERLGGGRGSRQVRGAAVSADPPKPDPAKVGPARTDPIKLEPPSPPAEAPSRTAASKPSASTTPAPPPSDGWAVQLGAFKSKDLAEKMVTTLKAKGYPAFVAPGVPYRVRVGPFAQHAEAVATASRLEKEQEGYTPRVIR